MTDTLTLSRAPEVAAPFRRTEVQGPWRIAWRSLKRDKAALAGGILVLLLALACLLAPLLAPADPYVMTTSIRMAPPGTDGHILGTDHNGRDMLSRLLWGGQVSLLVGFLPVAFSGLLGVSLGLLAGYIAGWWDHVIMRVLDVVLAFPAILLAIGLVATLGPGINNSILALMVVSVPSFARIVRASVLQIRELDYVLAARALGASRRRIMTRAILPNLLSPIIVYATLDTARMILFAAGLSFLGLGAQAPQAEWGAMLADGRNVLAIAPHVATFPGLAIFAVSLGLNLLGDGVRDALDPRMKV